MTIKDFIEYLNTLDQDTLIYINDSQFPEEILTDKNLFYSSEKKKLIIN